MPYLFYGKPQKFAIYFIYILFDFLKANTRDKIGIFSFMLKQNPATFTQENAH